MTQFVLPDYQCTAENEFAYFEVNDTDASKTKAEIIPFQKDLEQKFKI